MAGQGGNQRAGLAARQAAQRQARARNRRLLLAGGAIVVVVAVVLGILLFSRGGGSTGSTAGSSTAPPTGSALTSVLNQLTSVPTATSDQVGAGQASKPTTISGAALTSGGKPEVLYMGAEYCPYCAAERWGVIVALSRFGSFSGLAAIRSAATDGAGHAEPYPLTPTWTFVKSTYTSKYLTFTPVELDTNIPDKANGFYTTLQTPTAQQQALITKYDAAYQDAIPFIDYGNKYLTVGASYNPAVLAGLTWAEIADDLHNPASPVAQSVLGTANYATAAICGLTQHQPASACTSTVRALQAKI